MKMMNVPTNLDAEAADALAAAAELGCLIQRLGRTTVAGLILSQAQRELESLVRAKTDDANPRAFGPVRVTVAA